MSDVINRSNSRYRDPIKDPRPGDVFLVTDQSGKQWYREVTEVIGTRVNYRHNLCGKWMGCWDRVAKFKRGHIKLQVIR